MKFLLPLGLALVLVTGCAQRYTITTKNGSRISSSGKPKLVGSSYVYKDGNGQQATIPAVRVKEIAHESDSSTKPGFTPGSSR